MTSEDRQIELAFQALSDGNENDFKLIMSRLMKLEENTKFLLEFGIKYYILTELDTSDTEFINILEKAYLAGLPEASFRLSSFCFTSGDCIRGIKLLKEAAKAGHTQAQYDLATLYADGSVVQKDMLKCIHWYKRAAAKGHDESQHNLGFCYLIGDGVQKNINEGWRLIEISAENGNLSSIELLIECYSSGTMEKTKSKEMEAYWARKRLLIIKTAEGKI